MHLPAWTGWGYSKDFPRLETRPFRARFTNIKQDINNLDQGVRLPDKPVVPIPFIAQSLADQFTNELVDIGVKVHRLPEKELNARLEELLHEPVY